MSSDLLVEFCKPSQLLPSSAQTSFEFNSADVLQRTLPKTLTCFIIENVFCWRVSNFFEPFSWFSSSGLFWAWCYLNFLRSPSRIHCSTCAWVEGDNFTQPFKSTNKKQFTFELAFCVFLLNLRFFAYFFVKSKRRPHLVRLGEMLSRNNRCRVSMPAEMCSIGSLD